MAQVRMLVDISGGRPDGTEWPRYGDVLVCDEREARDHVAAGRAEWHTAPEPAADDAEPASAATDAPAADVEPQDSEDGSAPLVRDPKQAWIDHAVLQGADAAVAASMTKSDLIAQYGNPS